MALDILSDRKLDDQLLAEDDEEQYDALNDETFGIGADDGDWEEDHDKFAELIKEQSSSGVSQSSIFDISGFDGDDSQHEIVTQSISQLGLEDDLDDPAIMTIGRSKNIWPVSHVRSSPPPPAIIDPEMCGSPKTHSIWSTNNMSTPSKESGIGSLFSSIGNSCSSPYQHSSTLSPVPNNVFSTPKATKAWTLEELERDLTSKPSSGGFSSTSSNPPEPMFAGLPQLTMPEKHPLGDILERSATPKTVPGIRTLDDVETDILLKNQPPTVDEIEKSMKSNVRSESDNKLTYMPHPAVENAYKPVVWPMLNSNGRSGFARPLGPPHVVRTPGMFPTFPPPVITPDKANNFPGGFRSNFKPHPMFPAGLNSMPPSPFAKGHLPQNKQMFYPTSVLNPQNMKNLFLGRIMRHPLFGTPMPDYTWPLAAPNRFPVEGIRGPPGSYDEYAGLMSQGEKEWLLRVQLSLVQSDNPYVEDFYYSTFLTRKCAQEALKKKPDKTDGPKLLLPERAKTESKAYVPAQFVGSLGKLQAVSVNFPRKVLDITVSRPSEDEDGNSITNQSVSKNRRLLLNIEKLYNYLLEIDDEEKRIFALPDNAHAVHLENIDKLRSKLVAGLGCEASSSSDTFQNIMAVRKGRSLGMRSFAVFSKSQKLHFLVCLCRCLSHVLRKDQNDLVLMKNLDSITEYIKELSLPDLVLLGESLENLPRTDVIVPNPVREKSNFISAFKNKFGSSIVCSILQQADSIYEKDELLDPEEQGRWGKVILHIVDIICTLPDSLIVPPVTPPDNLLTHFQRFAVDRDKFDVLEKKLRFLKSDCPTPDNSG